MTETTGTPWRCGTPPCVRDHTNELPDIIPCDDHRQAAQGYADTVEAVKELRSRMWLNLRLAHSWNSGEMREIEFLLSAAQSKAEDFCLLHQDPRP